MRLLDSIRIRDPYFVTDKENSCYYLITNNDIVRTDGHHGEGVDAFRTTDLIHFDEAIPVLRMGPDYFSQDAFWAPEVHKYRGKWYLFATVKGRLEGSDADNGVLPRDHVQGTAIFQADHAKGPYRPWSDGPVTPRDYMALDGTFFLDRSGKPWMVFCHEWLQLIDGTIEAIPLSEDLKHAVGAPVHLFSGSDALWNKGSFIAERQGNVCNETMYITDGPYFFYDHSTALCMLWSTTSSHIYTTGIARSPSGELFGPWEHGEKALFSQDGGHAMLFKTLDGHDILTLHRPNRAPMERTAILPVEITVCGLAIL